ncbi:MAG TPA: hypothetical protein VK996_16175 [Ramlibacter sp.]|nr:hypothetical protein [Ramlibacter sp.]
MIQKNLVYHKTAKGTEAIATRQHGLLPKQRSMLIMIDGKRGYDELVRISQALGDPEQLLGQLFDDGFIEPMPGAAPAPAPSQATAHTPAAEAPATAGATTAAPRLTLKEAQRYAVRRLTDILGPNAEDFCLRIESAKNLHDFQVAVQKAEGMVRQFKGANGAQDFANDMQAHMPAA